MKTFPSWFSTSSATPRRLSVIDADITTLDVDAIVNAANEEMLGGGGVDGAIHRAAGHQLYEECKRVGPCPTGSARITAGYLLPAKFVIHAVGPVWMGGKIGEDALLASCYRASLELAVQREIQSIAFPAISCGIFGYPLTRACDIAVSTLAEGLEKAPGIQQVLIAVIDPKVEVAMREAMRKLRP